MPKKFGIIRKVNLGKYGCPYEAIDLVVEGCDSFEEATKEIKVMKDVIHSAFSVEALARKTELDAKAKLTYSEENERNELKKLERQNEIPF